MYRNEIVGAVSLLHSWLVRLEFIGIVIPTLVMFVGLGIYSLGYGGLVAIPFLIGPILSPVLIGSWALVHFYRVFDDKSDPGVVPLFFLVAYIGMCLYFLVTQELFATLVSGKLVPWLLGVLGQAIVGTHWLILFGLKFRLPRSRKGVRVSRLPDRL
jgi:hypothetical protein